MEYPDHYSYKEEDLIKLKKYLQSINHKNKIVITTEKDAVKLKNIITLSNLKFDIFVLQSNVSIIGENNEEELINLINKIC